MKRRIVFIAVVALLGALGVYSPATAGTGSPNECTGWEYGTTKIPILTTPITLGIVVYNGEGEHPRYRVCYSTSPSGWEGQDTTGGHVEYGSNVYWSNERGDYSWVECNPQSNPSALSPSCYVGQNDNGGTTACITGVPNCAYASAGTSGSGHDPGPATLSLSIPITACFGSCLTQSPSLGATGVLIGELDLTDPWGRVLGPPAGTSTGAGARLTALSYCVNGNCTPLSPETYVGAGVDASAGPAGTLLCYGFYPAGPFCVPGGAAAYVGPTIAAVQVGSTMIPVNSPVGAVGACVYSYEVLYETVLGVEWQVDSPCD